MKIDPVTVSTTNNLQNAMKELVKLVLRYENGTHTKINGPPNPGNAKPKLKLVPAQWNPKGRTESQNDR